MTHRRIARGLLLALSTSAVASTGFAASGSGVGGTVSTTNSETYATISGEIQSKGARFADSGTLTLSNQTSFAGAAASAYVDVTRGVMGGSAQALANGVSNATVDFRNRSVVRGAVAGDQATLRVTFDPTMVQTTGGALNPNDYIALNVSYRTAATYGGIEFKIWAGQDGMTCGPAFLYGHTRECTPVNTGPHSYDIAFSLPTEGNWLSIESDFWFQALDGARVAFADGVQLSLTVPQNVSLVSSVGAFPVTRAVPELSTSTSLALGGIGLLWAVRRQRQAVH
jgi:hypothetical protein